MSNEIFVFDYDAIYGFVDYGKINTDENGRYFTKMRCKKCGEAWLAENHLNGYSTCPGCGAQRPMVMAIE